MASYQEHGLKFHNWYRKRHGAPKMVLVERLNDAADAYALKLARRQTLVHNSGLDYGENLYMSWGRQGSREEHVADACKSWYDEIQCYSFGNPGFSSATGHFTAMVWKGSTQLGIGLAEVGNCVCVVANYKPWPNVQGSFGANVLQYRELEGEDSDDEEVKEKRRAEAEKAREEAERAAAEETKADEVPELPPAIMESFLATGNDEIGWQTLKDILNEHASPKNRPKFEGFEFDKAVCSLLISLVTFRGGEKNTVTVSELATILNCVETVKTAFFEVDVDRSGSLDPFEFKAACEEAGFKLSYKTFLTLQKQLGDDKGNMSLRAHLLCHLLLSKLQVVMETRAAGMFEDFSMRDWVEEELQTAGVE